MTVKATKCGLEAASKHSNGITGSQCDWKQICSVEDLYTESEYLPSQKSVLTPNFLSNRAIQWRVGFPLSLIDIILQYQALTPEILYFLLRVQEDCIKIALFFCIKS